MSRSWVHRRYCDHSGVQVHLFLGNEILPPTGGRDFWVVSKARARDGVSVSYVSILQAPGVESPAPTQKLEVMVQFHSPRTLGVRHGTATGFLRWLLGQPALQKVAEEEARPDTKQPDWQHWQASSLSGSRQEHMDQLKTCVRPITAVCFELISQKVLSFGPITALGHHWVTVVHCPGGVLPIWVTGVQDCIEPGTN